MSNPAAILSNLRRPGLLIRAARFGLSEYNRDRDLRRLMKNVSPPSPARALGYLLEEEQRLEETRKAEDPTYSINRHIEILIAVMAEARLLPATLRRVPAE